MKFIKGIFEIAENYDYYIIDLWGVLHDGHEAYKGAKLALEKLKNSNKKIILLSNAPRRSYKAKETLERLDFDENLYDLLLTSGEITYNYVKQNKGKLGNKYFYVGPDKDLHLLDGLNLTHVKIAAEANFAVATGFEGFGSKFEEKKHQLDECLNAKLHLLVANPDKLVVKKTGEEQICAGLMGAYYIEHGGKVTYFGKPHKNAYEECLSFFKVQDLSKILCVGDSLHTDIAGANMLGVASLFVTGGIHKKDLYENGKVNESKLKTLIEKENQTPKYLIDEFRW